MRMEKIFLIKQSRFFVSLILLELLLLAPTSFTFQESSPINQNENYFSSHSLIGVTLSEDPSASIAILKNERSGKIVMIKVGESIQGLKLIQVLESRIILKKGERTFQLFLGRSNLVNVDDKSEKKPSPTAAEDQHVELKGVDQTIIDLPMKEFIRSKVEKRIQEEWSLIIKETRFVPNIIDGKIRGFKITGLPAKSILSETGIHKNDIIKEINGTELNDMRTLFSLFDRFRDESQFEVHIERNGKSYRLSYTIK